MRKGRYNVELPRCYGDNIINKFNVYMFDDDTRFIVFEGEYVPITIKKPYKGGWLWQFAHYAEEEK